MRDVASRVTRRLGLWPVVPDAWTREPGNSEPGNSVERVRADVARFKMQRRRVQFKTRARFAGNLDTTLGPLLLVRVTNHEGRGDPAYQKLCRVHAPDSTRRPTAAPLAARPEGGSERLAGRPIRFPSPRMPLSLAISARGPNGAYLLFCAVQCNSSAAGSTDVEVFMLETRASSQTA